VQTDTHFDEGAPLTERDAGDARPALLRSLGFWDASAIVIGIIVGAGVFLVPGEVYLAVGSPIVALSVWVAGAGFSLCGVLLMAELGAMYPAAGGLYTYFRHAYGDLVAFLFAWTFFGAINAGVLAGLSTAVGDYIIPSATVESKKYLGVALLVALSILSILGISVGKGIQNTLTVVKVVGITLVVALLDGHRMLGTSLPRVDTKSGFTPIGFFLGLVAVLWAFDGWAWIGFSAEEMRNPVRDLPRALLFGVGVVGALYVALCGAVYFSMDAQQIRQSQRPVVDAVQNVLGSSVAGIINVIVLISILGSLNGVILTGPRSLFSLSRDGYFFSICSRVSRKYRTPYVAIIVQSLWVATLIGVANFQQLLTLVVFAGWLFYILLGAAVPILRYRAPFHVRPYKVRGALPLAVLFCTSAILVLASIVHHDPFVVLIAVGLISSGVPVYFFFAVRQANSQNQGSVP